MTSKKPFDNPWSFLPPQTLDQKVLDLAPRKYLVLDFWASWCEPCKESFPFYEKELVQRKTDQFYFVTVGMDSDRTDSINFLKKFTYSGLAIWDQNGALAKKFKIQGLPHFLILDNKSQVIFSQTGFSAKKKELILQKLRELNL